jgi:hypothetical protein
LVTRFCVCTVQCDCTVQLDKFDRINLKNTSHARKRRFYPHFCLVFLQHGPASNMSSTLVQRPFFFVVQPVMFSAFSTRFFFLRQWLLWKGTSLGMTMNGNMTTCLCLYGTFSKRDCRAFFDSKRVLICPRFVSLSRFSPHPLTSYHVDSNHSFSRQNRPSPATNHPSPFPPCSVRFHFPCR